MKNKYLHFFLIISFTVIFAAVAFAQKGRLDRDRILRSTPSTINAPPVFLSPAALDTFITQKMTRYRLPGISACVLKNGRIIWDGHYGFADIENNIPVTDSTLFMLASISKTFTGTALMKLYERGLVNLDEDVNVYLPQEMQIRNPSYTDEPITLKMILCHVSSINDNWDILDPFYSIGDSPYSLYSFLSNYLMPGGLYYANNNYNPWPPASTFSYCNEAIALAGYLVETITDTLFDQFCNKHIFSPLQLDETSWFLADLDTSHIARPYRWGGSSFIPYAHYGYPDYPSGQIRTSALQLAQFLNMFMQKGSIGGTQILDSSTVDLMTTIHYPDVTIPGYPDSTQGLIWYQEYYGDRLVWGHTGGDLGVSTAMFYYEQDNTGVIVLANGRSTNGVTDIVEHLFDYAWLYNKIYAYNVRANPPFMQAGHDTIPILSKFMNNLNHNFEAHAVIKAVDSAEADSIRLYDDGNHGDFQAGDGVWSSRIPPIDIESEFTIGISTVDLDSGGYFYLDDLARFTTIGPVMYEGFEFVVADTILNPGDMYNFRLLLRNGSATTAATNISAEVTCLDTNVTIIGANFSVNNIAPGQIVRLSGLGITQISHNCPAQREILFNVDILSNGYHFWSDSFFVTVLPTGVMTEGEWPIPSQYALSQNFPNPFNPVTSVNYQLPKRSHVTITIYNTLGQEIKTLLDDDQPAGFYTAHWDGTGNTGNRVVSGIYLYQIKAGDFVNVKKMAVVK